MIVGKRALPALALRADQLALLAEPSDAVIAFGANADRPPGSPHDRVRAGRGGVGVRAPRPIRSCVRSSSRRSTTCSGRPCTCSSSISGSSASGAGGSGFLYPFLERKDADLDAVLADVAASVRIKAHEMGELRERTIERRRRARRGGLTRSGSASTRAGRCSRSATAARRQMRWTSSPISQSAGHGVALDLTADASILTALANDVGPEVLFQRQMIAHGREADIALAFSTSGGSRKHHRGARGGAAARPRDDRRASATTAARSPRSRLADHVIVAPSEYIPRIQEAHATAYHLLCESRRRREWKSCVEVA